MPEYVVDCMHLPYGDGLTLVLPVSINGHVHERINHRKPTTSFLSVPCQTP